MAKIDQKKDVFKKIILEGMRNILIDELGHAEQNIKSCNDVNNVDNKAKGKAFLLFYLNKIFKDYYRIDSDSIQTGIIDNAGDKGIDFIAIDDNKVYILQTKYNYKKNNEIEDFLNIPQNIKSDYYKNSANSELKEFIREIKTIKNPEYILLYVTTEQATREEELHFEERAKSNNVQFSLIDFTALKAEYETVSTMGENPPDNITLNLGQEDYIHLSVEPNETILITQKGSKLKALYQRTDCKERLFNYNIRQWLGKNAVNKGMIETIEIDPLKFFYYNNGITAICENFNLNETEKIITCSKFQIVNGAQTLTTLAKQPDEVDLSQVKVLLKIVKADKYTTGDRDNSLASNIVKNNNSQTVIKAIDFRSNDLIQIDIDKKVKDNKLKYPLDYPMSQLVAYKRKRRLNEAKYKTITMENIAKTYYSMFINPCDIYLSSKKLWDISETGYYYKIFGCNGEKADSITDEEFYKLFASYYIYTYIDGKIKTILTNISKEDYPPYYFKYHIIWGINKLLATKYDNAETIRIFKQIVDKGYFLNEKIHANKAQAFSFYYEKIIKFITTEVKRIKDQTDNVAFRRLLVGKEFLKALEYRIEEIESSELPDLINESS